MKKIILTAISIFLLLSFNVSAQEKLVSERYGRTLNLGLGVGGYYGYYGYVGHSLPVVHINYEFDVAQNFTLAPFVTFYSYQRDHYRETVIPVGVKGTYYFDQLLRANSKWDFYLAGSLGYAIVNTYWNNNYLGDRDYYRRANPLFLDAHIGVEYHISNKLGVFLDLSSGVSTLGLSFR